MESPGKTLSTFIVAALLSAGAALGASEKQEVRQVAARFLEALSNRDAKAAAQTLLEKGTLLSVRQDGHLRRISFQQFLESLSRGEEKLKERMFDPQVLVHGDIAQVWAEYTFHINGQFSHCGIDSFSLVKTKQGWRIAAIVYTLERTGCKRRD